MKDKSRLYWTAASVVAACVVIATAACRPAGAQAEPAAADAAADHNKPATTAATSQPTAPELAVRLAGLAQDTLRQKVVVAPHFKQAAALLMAAARLDPKEPRYPRMLYEAMLQLHDNPGALKALKAYRDLQPADQLASVNFIDLTVGQLETLDARADYLQRVLDAQQVPAEVRSHAAVRAAQVARERGQSGLEDSFVGQALRLNPLNLEALRRRLDAVTANGTAVERAGTLLSMLKANPVQPAVTYALARELADAGATDESLQFYTRTVGLVNQTATPMPREFPLGYASELYMSGQPQLLAASREVVAQLLKQNPADVEALLLQWLNARAAGDKDALPKIQQSLLNASLNRFLTVRQQLLTATTGAPAAPTTRPIDSTDAVGAPDVAGDVEKLKDEKLAELVNPYAQTLSDLAWYMVLVANQPADATKILPTVRAILSDTHPVVVRIEGWTYLVQNQLDKAGVKLKAVADQDVMAQAGTYLLWAKNPAEVDPAKASARKLLQEHPSGLLAVLLSDTLRELNVKLVPRDDAAAMQAQVKEFPRKWLDIIESPQDFYILKAEMLGGRVLYPYGEPMFARVYVKNRSADFPITIGPDGVLRNDLWFDAQFRGLMNQPVTGAAYERLGQTLVLKPGQTISQIVRLDQGQLAQALSGNPNPSLTFYGQVRTNPRGDGGSGPAGYAVPFGSITERSGFGLNADAIRSLNTTLTTGAPADKVRSLELMAAEVEQLRAVQEQTDQTRTLTTAFVEQLAKAADDPSFGVATWGKFLTAVQSPQKRPQMVDSLIRDSEPARRILGLLIANSLPTEPRKQLLTKVLEIDKDETVLMYASGMLEVAKMEVAAPTTAPAAPGAPAGAPAGGPVLPGAGLSPNDANK